MGLRLAEDDRARERTSGTFGRYSLHDSIAVGEVSSVHLGLLEGASGFRKPVAFKRLQPSYVYDRAEVARLTYEACVLAHIHHPNVIQVLDLVETTGESYLVMEYVLGETLAGLVKSGARCTIPIAVAVLADALRGLDAAHAARGAAGQPLRVVHRNVCPENLLVGIDGVTRVLDFGSALSTTGTRTLLRDAPPNLGYAAPEQLMQQPVDRRADVFSAGVVLWEALTGKRLFRNAESRDAFVHGNNRNVMPASAFNAEVPRSLDEVVFRAIGWLPEERFDTASEFAEELELAVSPASRAEITAYVEKKAAASLRTQRAVLSAIDAPSGRISEPPGGDASDGLEEETMVFRPDHHLLHLGTPKRQSTPSTPAPLDVLRERLSTALERESFRPSLLGITTRLNGPLGRSARRVGSNVLGAGAAVLLLLAAVRLSRGTPNPEPAALAPVAQAAQEPSHASKEPVQPSRRMTAASMDLTPPDSFAQLEETRAPAEPAPAPAAEPTERDRTRAKAVVRRAPAAPADRGSCDPPFTLDANGIKRLKVRCL
jgi:eukaryotic-like serine/threonine-protein kinase